MTEESGPLDGLEVPLGLKDRAHLAYLDWEKSERERRVTITKTVIRGVLEMDPAGISMDLDFDKKVVYFEVEGLKFRLRILETQDKDATPPVPIPQLHDSETVRLELQGASRASWQWIEVEDLPQVGKVVKQIDEREECFR